jgi:UDP-N-acetylglucosamine--N-acetylmuramyl-(pentapeptide) pyrophosphoryl-undecaprenol N-acetylglucosamine transferase
LKIALACGGTGGHIFPGLATGQELHRRGHEVALWMAGRNVETPAVHNWTGPVITIRAEGLPSGFSLRGIRASYKLLRACLACRRKMRKSKPDVLLAMGSYASVGPVAAALSLKVPVVLHEANVLPGRAVALLSRWATAVAGCFEETRFYLHRKDLVITGMPIRKELEEAAEVKTEEPPSDVFHVLVMGGSLGAHRLNVLASSALCTIYQQHPELRVTHLTGYADEQAVAEVYRKANVPAKVHAFMSDMAPLYASAHLALCRSGAATCAELSAFGVPSLLVPYPFATHDHQMANARAMEKCGAADVVPEKDLSETWLVEYLTGCLSDPERLAKMRAGARSRAGGSGTRALADLIERVAMGDVKK